MILRNPGATCALYLFPLNALARDQEEKLKSFNDSLPPEKQLKIVTLIGEVSMENRKEFFADGPPHILICNPDLLHYQLNRGRQSGWKNWTEFLKRLRIVVLDEAHSYSGILGTY